jgi:hypothetical protein
MVSYHPHSEHQQLNQFIKKWMKEDASNYCPMTFVPTPSKILE